MEGWRSQQQNFNLASESSGSEQAGDFTTQDLQRHGAIVEQVFRQVHGRHPAVSQLPLQPVALSDSLQ